MRPRFLPRVAAVVMAVSVLGACSSGGGTSSAQPSVSVPAGSPEVVVKLSGFDPDAVEIQAGQGVLFHFDDGNIPHNATDRGGEWASPTLTKSDWGIVFDTPGTYDYYCTVHPNMKGTITVTAAG